MISNLVSKEFVTEACHLLCKANQEDQTGLLYEGSDLWWWWVCGSFENKGQQFILTNNSQRPVALIMFEAEGENAYECDVAWIPSEAGEDLYTSILDLVSAFTGDNSCTIVTHENDVSWKKHLSQRGWKKLSTKYVHMLLHEKEHPNNSLPADFAFFDQINTLKSKVDHPLAKRNGDNIAIKLIDCPLYNPRLDLHIRHSPSDKVAAYCLAWFDPTTQTGLIEPMRTESDFFQMGLGKCLLLEAIKRLKECGGTRIKVVYEDSNTAARALYESVGFTKNFKKEIWENTQGEKEINNKV